MTTDRTGIGQEVEAALGEVVAHVRGEAALPCRVVDAPASDEARERPQADTEEALREEALRNEEGKNGRN